MRRLLLVALPLIAALALACVAPSEGEPEPEAQVQDAVVCIGDADCASRCEAFADAVRRPVEAPRFERSRCELAALVNPGDDRADAEPAPSCLCIEGDTESSTLLLSPTGPDDCLVYGRDRSCVYHRRAFPGCDLDAPDTSCDSVCSEVQRRLDVDAIRAPRSQVRTAVCAETGCRCVLDINGTCYVDDWLDAYDCELTNEEIIGVFESRL